jgi:phage terminase small subunit
MIVALTAKQQRFCDEYLIDLNATQAAIRAGYSEKTAAVIAAENLRKPYIAEYIEKRMAEKEDALIAKQDEVMKYLTSVMRRELPEHVVVTLAEEKSYYAQDEDGKMRKRTEKKEFPEVVKIPPRLSDANKAAELLGKAYAIFTDRVESELDMELNITVDYGEET